MADWLLSNEPAVRLGAFVGVLLMFMGLEAVKPRRPRTRPILGRWFANLTIAGLSTLALRLLFLLASVTAVGLAALASQRGWGLFNAVDLPFWVDVLIAFLILDMAIYFQHRAFHHVPGLWRVHQVHHADLDIDASSGVRFHPVEIVLSMLIKFAIILIIGAPALAVLIFEIMLNGTSVFNHANLKLPASLDRLLRWLVVTPDMHRVHHSVHRDETDSNFGFNLPWWDRLFGSYRAQPRDGHQAMTLGLPNLRSDADQSLPALLFRPFQGLSR